MNTLKYKFLSFVALVGVSACGSEAASESPPSTPAAESPETAEQVAPGRAPPLPSGWTATTHTIAGRSVSFFMPPEAELEPESETSFVVTLYLGDSQDTFEVSSYATDFPAEDYTFEQMLEEDRPSEETNVERTDWGVRMTDRRTTGTVARYTYRTYDESTRTKCDAGFNWMANEPTPPDAWFTTAQTFCNSVR